MAALLSSRAGSGHGSSGSEDGDVVEVAGDSSGVEGTGGGASEPSRPRSVRPNMDTNSRIFLMSFLVSTSPQRAGTPLSCIQ